MGQHFEMQVESGWCRVVQGLSGSFRSDTAKTLASPTIQYGVVTVDLPHAVQAASAGRNFLKSLSEQMYILGSPLSN